MSEITWVKLSTAWDTDEKIKIIESMPDGDTLLVIWIKLISMAGRVNDGGLLYVTRCNVTCNADVTIGNDYSRVTYTPDTLARVLCRPIEKVKLALDTFNRMGMMTIYTDGTLALINWEKHQNAIGMDEIREKNRIRVQNWRNRQKQLLLPEPSKSSNATCNVTKRYRNADVTQQIKNKSKIGRVRRKRDPISSQDNTDTLDKLSEAAKAAEPDKPAPLEKASPLYQAIWQAMLSKNGQHFTNYKQEGGATKIIEKRCVTLHQEDPPAFAHSVIQKFWDLKQTGNDFWRGQPFTPSTLATNKIWDRVIEAMREGQLDDDIAAIIKGDAF